MFLAFIGFILVSVSRQKRKTKENKMLNMMLQLALSNSITKLDSDAEIRIREEA